MAHFSHDAADTDHEAACDMDEVRPHRECQGRLVRSDELTGGDQFDAVPDAVLTEYLVDDRQCGHDRQAHGIGELLIGCACSAFPTVDCDEVRSFAGILHDPCHLFHTFDITDHDFHPHRFPADFAELFDEIEELRECIIFDEAVRTVYSLTRLNQSDPRNLFCDFLPFKMAAAGFCTLSQFDFKSLHLIYRRF